MLYKGEEIEYILIDNSAGNAIFKILGKTTGRLFGIRISNSESDNLRRDIWLDNIDKMAKILKGMALPGGQPEQQPATDIIDEGVEIPIETQKKAIGRKLRIVRLHLNKSQKEVAAALGYILEARMSQFEGGTIPMINETRTKIAQYYGVPYEWLWEGKGTPPQWYSDAEKEFGGHGKNYMSRKHVTKLTGRKLETEQKILALLPTLSDPMIVQQTGYSASTVYTCRKKFEIEAPFKGPACNSTIDEEKFSKIVAIIKNGGAIADAADACQVGKHAIYRALLRHNMGDIGNLNLGKQKRKRRAKAQENDPGVDKIS
jgi:transcriptional regulator with XRE-family HTH domain